MATIDYYYRNQLVQCFPKYIVNDVNRWQKKRLNDQVSLSNKLNRFLFLLNFIEFSHLWSTLENTELFWVGFLKNAFILLAKI